MEATPATKISGYCRGIFEEKGETVVVFEKCLHTDILKTNFVKSRGRGPLSRFDNVCVVRNPGRLPGFFHLTNPFVYFTIEVVIDRLKIESPVKTPKKKNNKRQKKAHEAGEEDLSEEEPNDSVSDEQSRDRREDKSVSIDEDDEVIKDLENVISEDKPSRKRKAEEPIREENDTDGDEEKREDSEVHEDDDGDVNVPRGDIYEDKCTKFLGEYLFVAISNYENVCEPKWNKVVGVLANGFFFLPYVFHALVTADGPPHEAALEFLDTMPSKGKKHKIDLHLTEMEETVKGVLMDIMDMDPSGHLTKPNVEYAFMSDIMERKKPPQKVDRITDSLATILVPMDPQTYSQTLKTIIDLDPACKMKDLEQENPNLSYFYSTKPAIWKRLTEVALSRMSVLPDTYKNMEINTPMAKIMSVTIFQNTASIYPYAKQLWAEYRPASDKKEEIAYGLAIKYEARDTILLRHERISQEVKARMRYLSPEQLALVESNKQDAELPPDMIFASNIASALQLFVALGRPNFERFLGDYLMCASVAKASDAMKDFANEPHYLFEITPYNVYCQYGCVLPEGSWLPPDLKVQGKAPFCGSVGIMRNTPEEVRFRAFLKRVLSTRPGERQEVDREEEQQEIDRLPTFRSLFGKMLESYVDFYNKPGGRSKVLSHDGLEPYPIVPSSSPLDYFLLWKRDKNTPLDFFSSEDDVRRFHSAMDDWSPPSALPRFYLIHVDRMQGLYGCVSILSKLKDAKVNFYDTIDVPRSIRDTLNKKYAVERILTFVESALPASTKMLVVCQREYTATEIRKLEHIANKCIVVSLEGINKNGRQTQHRATKRTEMLLYALKNRRNTPNDIQRSVYELYKELTGMKSLAYEAFVKYSKERSDELQKVDVIFTGIYSITFIDLCRSIAFIAFDKDSKLSFWIDSLTVTFDSGVLPRTGRHGYHSSKFFAQWNDFNKRQKLLEMQEENFVLNGEYRDQEKKEKIEEEPEEDDDSDFLDNLKELMKGHIEEQVPSDNEIESFKPQTDEPLPSESYDKSITSPRIMFELCSVVTDTDVLIQGEDIKKLSETRIFKHLLCLQAVDRMRGYPSQSPWFKIIDVRTDVELSQNVQTIIDIDDWKMRATYYDWMYLCSIMVTTGSKLHVVDTKNTLRPWDLKGTLTRAITLSKKCVTPNLIELLVNYKK